MNAQVLSTVFGDIRASAGDLFAAATAGDLDALVLVGSDPVGDGLFPSAAQAALDKVALVQIGSIAGEIGQRADVQLPAAACSEIDGSFVNMEGRIRVATHPIRSLGQERPLWKVMMRLIQSLGSEVPVINLAELREQVGKQMPALNRIWQAEEDDSVFV